MTDTTSAESDYNRCVLSARWTAVPNDMIGGWCVSIDGRTPADGGVMAADMVTRELAEHIAAMQAAHLDGRILPEPSETRTEWGVWWHAGDPDGISMSCAQLRSRSEAERVAKTKIGQYGITGYTLVSCEHRLYVDESTWIGGWQRAETVMPVEVKR